MWYQRNQFDNSQLPVHDIDLIRQQQSSRTTNHPYNIKSKGGQKFLNEPDTISVGDIVYLFQDKSKTCARPQYIVASIDGDWCFIRKFIEKQLRETAYKVMLKECYKVPEYKFPSCTRDFHEEIDKPTAVSAIPYQIVPIEEQPKDPQTMTLPAPSTEDVPIDTATISPEVAEISDIAPSTSLMNDVDSLGQSGYSSDAQTDDEIGQTPQLDLPIDADLQQPPPPRRSGVFFCLFFLFF